MKKQKTIVIGITSGIAAYKVELLIKRLRGNGHNVFVVMSTNATQMISPRIFQKASGNPIYTMLFDEKFSYKTILKNRKVDHITLADSADLVIIAPSTANIIAKIAHGIADDFLTTMLLATKAPVLVCPSMNVHMWENPIVQENIYSLLQRGFHILDPEVGALACGYEGKGRLASIEHIYDQAEIILTKSHSLQGKKVLVTAGGTSEKIDDVRVITNRSSGKMGIALAQECQMRGAEVLLLKAKSVTVPYFGIMTKEFETNEELEKLLKEYLGDYQIVFHAAAVSDFVLKNPYSGKMTSDSPTHIELVPAKKLVATIKKTFPAVTLIPFKAEYNLTEEQLMTIGKEKCHEWNADAVIVNDVGKKDQGFDVDENEVYIVSKKNTPRKIAKAPKKEIAQNVIHYLLAQKII